MRTALALVVLIALAALSVAAGYGPYRLCEGFVDLVGDKLERRASSLAGSQGVNCGRVESGHDARAANDCVRNSLALGKAFRVRYKVLAIESSSLSTGLVRSTQGRLYEIVLDGNPGRAGATSLFRQQIAVKECSTELRVTHGGRLTCIADRGY
jgi:hypothetical protein